MFVNEEECENFLIIGGSADHSSQQLFLLSYQSLDVTCPCLLLSWDACVYRQATEW